jgi:hypothetical protein
MQFHILQKSNHLDEISEKGRQNDSRSIYDLRRSVRVKHWRAFAARLPKPAQKIHSSCCRFSRCDMVSGAHWDRASMCTSVWSALPIMKPCRASDALPMGRRSDQGRDVGAASGGGATCSTRLRASALTGLCANT